MHITEEVFV